MIARLMRDVLLRRAGDYPVVTVVGPRQAGKTTLVREAFPHHAYINLEHPAVREFATQDPEGFFRTHVPPLILDEIQRVPDLLSYIQVVVDRDPAHGRFVLTGSNQPALGAGISQSLAGRTSIVRLLPLSMEELANHGVVLDRDEFLFKGFLPRVYHEQQAPGPAYQDYLATYVERDLRQLANLRDLTAFQTFLRLLAGRVGQLVNLHSLAADTGVTSTTLAHWLTLLEASFVVFRLTPWYRNIGKRLVKTPKLYFYEAGLLASLLQVDTVETVARDPLIGGMFENMVVVELLKAQWNRGLRETLTFYRDSSGREVDIVMEHNRIPRAIEIKSARTFSRSMARTLREFQALVPDTDAAHLVYGGTERIHATGFEAVPFFQTADIVRGTL